MENNHIQAQLFQQIRGSLPPHVSFVDEVAELLNISNDSAYRRIRGEKMLSLEELKKICNRFRISIDKLLNLETDSTIFTGQFLDASNFVFDKFLDSMYYYLNLIHSFEQKEVYYFSKDLSVFHYFLFPELGAFKFFMWMKTLISVEEFMNQKFSIGIMQGRLLEKGKQIGHVWSHIPTHEIVNVDNIMITIRQIEYYKDIGLFETAEDLDILYTRLIDFINHLESMCELGTKFLPGEKPNPQSGFLKMYVNDFTVGDNSNLAVVNGGQKMAFLNHNVLNILTTTDKRYCDYTHDFLQNIIRKSMMISVVGEKQRKMYFNLARDRVLQSRNNQLNSIYKY